MDYTKSVHIVCPTNTGQWICLVLYDQANYCLVHFFKGLLNNQRKMAFHTISFALRRMRSTSTPSSAEMFFTFAAPNNFHYNKAKVDVP